MKDTNTKLDEILDTLTNSLPNIVWDEETGRHKLETTKPTTEQGEK